MRRAALPFLILAFGCSGTRRPEQPSALDRGAIAARVAIKGRELPNFIRHQADQLYWARLNSFGDLDLDHPIETTLAKNGDLFVLDLPPGKYAPFAAAYSGLRIRFLARLDNEVRKQMTVEVEPGRLVFAGDTLVRSEFEGVLVGLEHLGRRLLALLPPWKRSNIDITTGSPRIDKTPALELAMLKRAQRSLSGTQWRRLVDERIVELGNPADPITTGLIRKKKVPPKRAHRFSYMETLDWGAPEEIPGGLQWREPKGRARVAVTFVSYSSRTLEVQLDKLKLAGSPEDDHTLYDVRVGSMPAKAVRFTSYAYGKDALVGDQESVHVTEALVVPQREGYYMLLYRAGKGDFERWRREFADFVQRLKFLGPPSQEEREKDEKEKKPA